MNQHRALLATLAAGAAFLAAPAAAAAPPAAASPPAVPSTAGSSAAAPYAAGSSKAVSSTAGAPSVATPATNGSRRHRPDTYVVSQTPGDTLEGIEVTRDGTMYVTSVGTGAVFRGSVRNPTLRLFLPAGSDGRTAATGVHVDRWGRVLVAGAGTAKLFMYDTRGRLLAARTAKEGSFLNDFTFTRDAVYVTDSAHNMIWRASLTRTGLGELKPWITREQFEPMPYFLNGIVLTPDGRTLLVSEQGLDLTFRVDIRTATARPVEVTGANGLLSGDGYLLEGHRLYAVYYEGNGRYFTRLAVLDRTWSKARIIADSDVAPAGSTPTTVARDRGRLLWVNSQLDVAPGTPPYTVSVVPGLR